MKKLALAMMLGATFLTVGCHKHKKKVEVPVAEPAPVVQEPPVETEATDPGPVQGPAP